MDPETLTLEQVRDSARTKLKGICGVYRTCDGLDTRLCQGHGYGSPIGMGGTGSGASFANNIRALDAVRLTTRVAGVDFNPDTRCTFFGQDLSMPIMAASVSGVNSFGGDAVITEEAFCAAVVSGCTDAGTLGWRGDSFNYSLERPYGIEAIAAAGGRGVQIVKPRDNAAIIRFFQLAQRAGCTAVGVDVDGFGSYAMAQHNQAVFRKNFDDLTELVRSTPLPFIVKGVMTAADAEVAVKAGAAAIVVSNHGGRVMDHTPGTAEVLPEIVAAVGQDALIFADGGIRNGYDALKMLALGARAVLVGRDIVRAAVGGGRSGVRLQMEQFGNNLARAMKMAGCKNLESVSRDILCST